MAKFQKGEGGRPRGSRNKFTSLKDEFLNAFEQIGGTEELATWARKNQTQFYTLLSKLLPSKSEVTGEDGGPVQGTITVRFVSPDKK